MNHIEYYINDKYEVTLYKHNDTYIIQQTEHQALFSCVNKAKEFLLKRNYILYRITTS